MRDYDVKLVDDILSSKTYTEVFGVTSEVYHIPDKDIPGVLDPREEALARTTLTNRLATLNTVEAIRKQTEFPNKDISTSKVNINEFYVHSKTKDLRVLEYSCLQHCSFCIVYIHGGSFFAGSTSLCHNTCKAMASLLNVKVFSLDISLAPECPFPNAIEDVYHFLMYLYNNHRQYGVDINRVILCGDSSGANIAISPIFKDLPFKIYAEVLYYPVVSLSLEDLPFKWDESLFCIKDEYRPFIIPRLGLGRSDSNGNDGLMRFICSLYLQKNEDRHDKFISPIYGDISKMPKTLIFTAEYDGLRLQGEYFASLLKRNNIKNRLVRFNGLHHGFLDKIGVFPQSECSILIMKDFIFNE